MAEAKSPAEAAALLNQKIFPLFGVKYSTKRKKADQSPGESIETGLASCTGLSILLIDACRAVGVPARFVGTPLWSDGSGNHSWVEVWDDGWHFTGAAEPNGMDLDRAWFTGRAATANRHDPRNSIYAVTWRRTPLTFPMVWREGDPSYHAVDVTDRYAASTIAAPAGCVPVRFQVLDTMSGERFEADIEVRDAKGELLFEGTAKDERFDANDHVTAYLAPGIEFTVKVSYGGAETKQTGTVEEDEQLVTIRFTRERAVVADPIAALETHLADSTIGMVAGQPFAVIPLPKGDVARAAELLRVRHVADVEAERVAELEAREITLGTHTMPFWYEVFGERPAGGRSLFISMHGGGEAPQKVNDRQYENQKRLYEPEEGIYLVPRAPTDTWNLWHQAHIDKFFDRLIENLIVLEEVDPDRVYFMGYSAGGDGVYQLAPRMADRLAAAAMMAGHPNETQPDGLRNIGFTLHMGGKDAHYRRNEIAGEWKEKLGALRESDPDGYAHWVEIYEDKQHSMDREDAAALPWMADFTRNLRPKKIVWLQDDVTHRRFYWLAVKEPVQRHRLVVEREGQTIRIVEATGPNSLTIRLDDSMLDLDRDVVVTRGDEELFRGRVPRTIGVLARTLAERGDPKGLFCAEISVSWTDEPEEEAPLLSFGLVSDAQYCDKDPAGTRHYRNSLDKLALCVEDLNQSGVDFTIHLGDFIDAHVDCIDQLLPVYAELEAPRYQTLGNHDFDVTHELKDTVSERLGMPSRYYDFTVAGHRFLVLDGNDVSLHGRPEGSEEHQAAQEMLAELKQAGVASAQPYNGAVGYEQLAWLESTLGDARDAGEPAIVFCHFPVYPPTGANLWNDREVIEVLEASETVVAFINGHDHAGGHAVKNGIHYLTVQGMVETADTTAYSVVRVEKDRLVIDGRGRQPDLVLEFGAADAR